MANKIKPLPKNWQTHVENHISVLRELEKEAKKDLAKKDTHEGVCHAFHFYLKEHFGSTQGFGDFLRKNAEKAFEDMGLPIVLLDTPEAWKISGKSVSEEIGNVANLYGFYKRFTDGLAHHKAMHHATPPDFKLQ